jgi:cellulose synthase/poly-beta-1,6-N-acetylglucosamine synthase-like glycosyltransferase
MLEAAFVAFLVAAAYPVAIYPLLVLALSRLAPRPWLEGAPRGPVAHVIAVHDEQARIAAKLDNALALDLPPGSRTVVADDGSRDRTGEIVRTYAARGVSWIGCPRRGKEHAQIEAVRRTTEPILVFSDASTALDRDAVAKLLRPFADPRVAAVSGTDRLAAGAEGTGEDLYVRFEMAVRRAESLSGSLVGLSGCFFAMRREVAEGLLPDVPSDLGAALVAIRCGMRAVAQEDAICRYVATPEAGREFARKRRTALRGLRGLRSYRGVLSLRRPVESWQLLSHKWLRFAVPLFGLGAFATAAIAAAAGSAWGGWFAGAVLVALLAGAGALRSSGLRRLRPVRGIGFAVLSTAAVLAAWLDLARGVTRATWTPTTRSGA